MSAKYCPTCHRKLPPPPEPPCVWCGVIASVFALGALGLFVWTVVDMVIYVINWTPPVQP